MARLLGLTLLAFIVGGPILFAAVVVGLVCPAALPLVAVGAVSMVRRTFRTP